MSTSVGVVCPNSTQVRAAIRYPREALKDNLTGDVVVSFVVGTDGNVKDLSVTRSAAPVLDRAAENAVRQFHCVAQGEEVRVQVPFSSSSIEAALDSRSLPLGNAFQETFMLNRTRKAALATALFLAASAAHAATDTVTNPYGLDALWKGGDFIARGTLLILRHVHG